MFRVSLNFKKANNYAFFCPVTKLHLTVRNPVGTASEVSPAILHAVKMGILIDNDNAIDLTTGKLKVDTLVLPQEPVQEELQESVEEEPQEPAQEESVQEGPVQEEPVNEPISEPESEDTTQQNKRRGRKSKSNK